MEDTYLAGGLVCVNRLLSSARRPRTAADRDRGRDREPTPVETADARSDDQDLLQSE